MKHDKFVVHVVDPDPAIADGLATLFDTYGIEVFAYPDAEAFLELTPAPCTSHCCLLIAADLPGISGPALLQRVRDNNTDTPVLLLISTSSPEMIKVAKSSRQVGVVEKPCANGMLIEKVLQLRRRA